MKIAITGNIGSGKSEVIKYLLKKNYCCISSDKIIAKLHQEENFKNFISSQLHLDKKNYKEQLINNLKNNEFNKQLKKIHPSFSFIPPYLPTPWSEREERVISSL